MSNNNFLNSLNTIFDKKDIKLDEFEKHPYSHDWSSLESTEPLVVIFPRDKKQVLETINLCNSSSQAFFGSGGRTGLSGGATAIDNEVVISFEKMNKILDFDESSKSLLCEPGLITKDLQNFAFDNDLFYPIDFSSTGSSQIGGNIATNAGGIRVIKYGLTERYVQGLEVVSGDGSFLNYNKGLIKNATGPNFKNIFIGSEGCFGLFTKCNIKLVEKPKQTNVVILSFNELSNLEEIINSVTRYDIEAVEFFTKQSSLKVAKEFNINNPLGFKNHYYLILEFSDAGLLSALEKMISSGIIDDVIISHNSKQKDEIWKNRMLISESIFNNKPIKFDIAVPVFFFAKLINKIERFVHENNKFMPILFGHAGDGNLHANFIHSDEETNTINKKDLNKLNTFIYECVENLNGTISAEHGIGYLKKEQFKRQSLRNEMHVLKSFKKIFDPKNLLNPSKLIP